MKKLLIAALALASAFSCKTSVPLVYNQENTAPVFTDKLADFEELDPIPTLPDPFVFINGKKLGGFSGWEKRRAEITAQLQYYEIGIKPATPKECVSAELVHGVPEPPVFESPFPMPDIPLAADTMIVKVSVGGNELVMHCPVIYPEEGEGPFPAIIGIGFWAGAGNLPTKIFTDRNIAMIGFPFYEVMAHQQIRGQEPINVLYPELQEMGAYAGWSWGVSRLIDALEILGEASRIDMEHLAISGCSFAGKMALFAGALDERIALTIAQEPGGGGAAAWRVSETLGNVETIGRTDYHWFKESMRRFSEENVAKLPIDHHELCALVAPRALLVFGNPDYPWLADESGYVSCSAAYKVWEKFGIGERMGWSFQAGHGHCQLPKEQWPDLEAFVDKFLLGKDTDTNIHKAPMFENVDVEKWNTYEPSCRNTCCR